jgi:hypothetical protein
MKKEYIKPQVEVVRVNVCQPLADSINKVQTTVGIEYGGGGNGGGRSRGSDDWDDWDE